MGDCHGEPKQPFIDESSVPRLHEIADAIRAAALNEEWDWDQIAQTGSRLLLEALQEGAFSGAEFEPLRYELDEVVRHGRNEPGNRYCRAPGDVLEAAADWLTRQGCLPGEYGGGLILLEHMKSSLPDLIRGQVRDMARRYQRAIAERPPEDKAHPVPPQSSKPTQGGKAVRAKCKRKRKPNYPRKLTDKQREAWIAYGKSHCYTEVGRVLGITRQAAKKRVEAAQEWFEATSRSRSVGACQRLPEDRRGNLAISGNDRGPT